MQDLRAALLAEGTTDKALLPILEWLFDECCPGYRGQITLSFVEPAQLAGVGKQLAHRIPAALRAVPCDLLFVHRDADTDSKSGHKRRVEEIRKACSGISEQTVCVVPVHETEAWLLIEEDAIWRASERRKGSKSLKLPKLSEIERLAKPKEHLEALIRETGCRDVSDVRNRLPNVISNYSVLRQLPAFQALENETREAVQYLLSATTIPIPATDPDQTVTQGN